ncbi:MAG: YbhB/YbcL family Raf kinase inhibitor-like protein [Abyssibacter sp.]|nr:YbhB/YbcL family Raf kinase inhibitor-like protein [Abyssibacter sp.]MCK5858693.1 YbhB/YbcL family Raf kinase inhibitor-like protein [Abyssibacter sp.]
MKLTSESFADQTAIPGRCAFAVKHPDTHVQFSDNRNPQLTWSDAPQGTSSFALLCVDPDAPTKPDDVNQDGRTVPADLPRANFAHWAMVDIPSNVTEIGEGACSQGVSPRGKSDLIGPEGSRQGKNDYSSWFDGDADMEGTYRGYDGPCPPWNDAIAHRYVFKVYALDCATLELPDSFTVADVETAAKSHILASAELTGLYSLNPDVPAE